MKLTKEQIKQIRDKKAEKVRNGKIIYKTKQDAKDTTIRE